MKKKIVSILLIAALAITGLCACGAPEGGQSQQQEQQTGSAPEETPSDEGSDQAASAKINMISEDLMGSAPAEGADFSQMKIGEIANTTLDDGGWSQTVHEGILSAMKDLGIPEGNLISIDSIAEEQAAVQESAEQLIGQGCNLIISGSTGFASYLPEIAAAHPDVKIAQWGSTKPEGLIGYDIRSYEGMFMAGYACELMSKDENPELGFSASMQEFSVVTAINAYTLGAKYANPEATVQVACADSWYDLDKEKQCAQSLIDKNIKYMGMEASSPSIPQTCEENGAYVVGYHRDISDYAPKAVLTSFTWNFAPIFKQIMISINDGSATTDDFYFWGGDCSQLSDFADFVPDDVKTAVTELKGKIDSGEVQVYGGPLNDNKGNELVKEGEVMADEVIIPQEFFVEGVNCAWEF